MSKYNPLGGSLLLIIGALVSAFAIPILFVGFAVQQKDNNPAGYMIMAVSAAEFLVGISLVIYHFISRNRLKFILQNGSLTDGTVTSVAAGSIAINGIKQWQISYTYRGLQGGEYTGKTKHMAPDLAQQWKSGEKGRVRFDPAKPQISVWVGKDQNF